MKLNTLKQVVFLWTLLALTACTTPPAPQQAGILKPESDKRSYEYLVLPNQMRVVLVSDPEADMAAASLSLPTGSNDNPVGRDGLAHFLEHMLFMGTEKYPGVDEYAAFISQHGGSNNAFTADTNTTYFFDIKHDQLQPALDRFAQFFISPLFTEGYVDREKNAVQSEYQLSLKEDDRRILAAQQQTYNPQNPYSRFSVGSLDTLSDRPDDKVRDDLVAFYQAHYSADRMTLAVLGRESLAELRQMVEPIFAAVPKRGAAESKSLPPLYAPGSLPLLTRVVPLKDSRRMEMEWPIPSQIPNYREHPGIYLSNLLGHEGEGSLLSLLKAKGWVTALSAGSDSFDHELGLFSVSMELTPEGYEHWQEVGQHVFQYINMVQQRGIEEWRYDEQRRMAQLNFRFQERKSSGYALTKLSGDLLDYPAYDLLRANSMMEDYDAKQISALAKYLTPENLALTLIAPDQQTDQVEGNYGTAYSSGKLPAEVLSAWSQPATEVALALPQPNPFVPDQVALKPVTERLDQPKLLDAGTQFPLWFQQDDSFGVPKGAVSFILKSPLARDSSQHAVLKSLYKLMLDEQLNEYAYAAQLAGLNYSLKDIPEGLRLTIYGYDQKQSVLLDKIIQALAKPDFPAERFAIHKARLERELKNMALEPPYRQILSELRHYLVFPSWSPEEQLAVLPELQLDDLKQYGARYFDELEVIALVYGNHTEQQARELAQQMQAGLLAKTKMVKVKLPKVEVLVERKPQQRDYEVDHPDSVVLRYFQGQDEGLSTQAQWRLLGQVMSNPFFAELRSEQQLGYLVAAAYVEVEEEPGLLQLVQSSSASHTKVSKSMAAFSKEFAKALAEMPAQEYADNQAGLIAELTKKDETYLDRALRYLDALMRKNPDFKLDEKLAKQVAEIGQKDMLGFYRQQVLEQPKSVVVYSKGAK